MTQVEPEPQETVRESGFGPSDTSVSVCADREGKNQLQARGGSMRED